MEADWVPEVGTRRSQIDHGTGQAAEQAAVHANDRIPIRNSGIALCRQIGLASQGECWGKRSQKPSSQVAAQHAGSDVVLLQLVIQRIAHCHAESLADVRRHLAPI